MCTHTRGRGQPGRVVARHVLTAPPLERGAGWDAAASCRTPRQHRATDALPVLRRARLPVLPDPTPGCLTGGCHGPLTRQHGLGVDNVLGARIALYNGTIINVGPTGKTSDLFTALLGAGGGVGVGGGVGGWGEAAEGEGACGCMRRHWRELKGTLWSAVF